MMVFAGFSYGQPEQITVYTYHDIPPFLINAESNTGLSYDFIHALNRVGGGNYVFSLKVLHRTDINQRLADGLPTVVIWASPKWFETDATPYQYLWSDKMFSGAQVVVNLKGGDFDYRSPISLLNKKIGIIKGHSYSSEIVELGDPRITYVEAATQFENINNLLSGKVEVILIPKSVLLYVVRAMGITSIVNMAPQAIYRYKRHLLLSQHYSDRLDEINGLIKRVMADEQWLERVKLYAMKSI